MKKFIAAIAVVCIIVITGAVLVITGVVQMPPWREANAAENAVASFFVKWDEAYVTLDADSVAMSISKEKPDDLPKVSGIEFVQISEGQKAETGASDLLDYAQEIAKDLRTYSVDGITEIVMSKSGEATLRARNITINLGKNDGTGTKINDLSNFYETVSAMHGTLDMTSTSELNLGYVFKKASENESADGGDSSGETGEDANVSDGTDGGGDTGAEDGSSYGEYTDGDYAYDDYANDEYADDEYADGDYADEDYADDEYADEDYADDEYADEDYADEEYADDEYADGEYVDDEYADEDYSDGDYAG